MLLELMGNSTSLPELQEPVPQAKWFIHRKSKCKKTCGFQLHKSGKVIFQKHCNDNVRFVCTNTMCKKHFRAEAKPVDQLPDVCNASVSKKKPECKKSCIANNTPDNEVNLLAKQVNVNSSVDNKELNLLWIRSEVMRGSESTDVHSQEGNISEEQKKSPCHKCHIKKKEYSHGPSLIHTSFMQTVFPNKSIMPTFKKTYSKHTSRSPINLQCPSGSSCSHRQQSRSYQESTLKGLKSKKVNQITLDKPVLDKKKSFEDPKSECGPCFNEPVNGSSEQRNASKIGIDEITDEKKDSEITVATKNSKSQSFSAPPTPSISFTKKVSNPRIFGEMLNKNDSKDLIDNFDLLTLTTGNDIDSPTGSDTGTGGVEVVEEVVKAINITPIEAVNPRKIQDKETGITANKSQSSTIEIGSWGESEADITTANLLFPKETYQNIIMNAYETRKQPERDFSCTSKPPRPKSSKGRRFQTASQQQVQSFDNNLDSEQCRALIPCSNTDIQLLPVKKTPTSEVTFSQSNIEKIKITVNSQGKFQVCQKTRDNDYQNPLVINIKGKEILQKSEMENSSISNRRDFNIQTAYPNKESGISDGNVNEDLSSAIPTVDKNYKDHTFKKNLFVFNQEKLATRKVEEQELTHHKYDSINNNDYQNPLQISIKGKEILQKSEMENSSISNRRDFNGETAHPNKESRISDGKMNEDRSSTIPTVDKNYKDHTFKKNLFVFNQEKLATRKMEEQELTHHKYDSINSMAPSIPNIGESIPKIRDMLESQSYSKVQTQDVKYNGDFPDKYQVDEKICIELSHVGRFRRRCGMGGYEIFPSKQFPPALKYHPSGFESLTSLSNSFENRGFPAQGNGTETIIENRRVSLIKNNSIDLLRTLPDNFVPESFSKAYHGYDENKQNGRYHTLKLTPKINDKNKPTWGNSENCRYSALVNLDKPLIRSNTYVGKSNTHDINTCNPKLSNSFSVPTDSFLHCGEDSNNKNIRRSCEREGYSQKSDNKQNSEFFPHTEKNFGNRTEIVNRIQQTIPGAYGESRGFSNIFEKSHVESPRRQKRRSNPVLYKNHANMSSLSAIDECSMRQMDHREGCKYWKLRDADPESSNSGSSKSGYVPPYHKALAMFQRRTGERPRRRYRRRRGSLDLLSGNWTGRRNQHLVSDVKSGPVVHQHYRSPSHTTRMNGMNGHGDLNGSGGELISQNLPKGCWTIGLINSKFRYLTAETFGFKINANGASLKKKQIWTLEPSSPSGTESTIYLKSHLDKYLAVDSFGNVTCESEERDPGSKFQISVADDGTGRWALRNVTRGYFLGASADKLTCTAKVPGDAELWHVHLAARPQVNLRSVGRKRFAHLSENLDEIHVDANIPWGEDTLFTLEFRVDESGKYALHTCNNKYLSREGKLVDTCNPNCLFSAEYHSGQLALRDRQGAYLSPIGSKAVLKSRSQTVTKDELFSLEDSLPQASFVAALNGRYVSVKQGVDVTANQDEISDHETFQLEFDSNTKRWYIRTMQDRYWTLETGGGIQACGDKRSSNALFDLVWQGDGSVGFRANNGKFISTKRSGHLYANCDTVEDNAKYFFYLINRPILVLKCEQGFVGYKSATSPKLECNKATYETIQVERSEKGVVFFKGQNGKYWHVDGESVTADSDTPEGFFLELRDPTRICIKSVSGEYLVASKNGSFRLGDSDFENATKWEY